MTSQFLRLGFEKPINERLTRVRALRNAREEHGIRAIVSDMNCNKRSVSFSVGRARMVHQGLTVAKLETKND